MMLRRGRRPASDLDAPVDLSTRVGDTALASPVLIASGTGGYGVELAPYVDLASIGGLVTKSLAAYAWDGNPPPRVHPAAAGMINAVGLQGPGVRAWRDRELPALLASGATIVASIWGRSVDDYATAADALGDLPAAVVAVEVNLSCPNVAGKGMFAQSAVDAAAVMRATTGCGRPRWAKLTAAVTNIVEIASAVNEAGASAVALINTVPAMAINVEARRPVLGNGSGGLSGLAIGPVAVKAIWDVHAALPDVPIVGAGGVANGRDVVERMMAGASAVQVGTANFADPAVTSHIQRQLVEWCRAHDISAVGDLVGIAHR